MTAAEDGRLGIVIVNYGSHQLLADNLGTVDLDRNEIVVVVVDNYRSTAQRDLTRAYVYSRGWEFIATDSNLGFGAAVNIGAEKALQLGCGALLFLNPDAVASADVFRQLKRSASEDPTTMVSPRICRPDGTVWFSGSEVDLHSGRLGPPEGVSSEALDSSDAAKPDSRTMSDRPILDHPEAAPWLTAACLMVPAALWRRIGGFDVDYFLYWEDVDLSYRCLQAGGNLRLRHDLTAIHLVGATQELSRKSLGYFFYNCRNRLLFAAKHLSRRRLVSWLVRTPAQSWAILLRGGGRRGLISRPSVIFSGLIGSLAGIAAGFVALVRPRPEPSVDYRAPRGRFPFISESPVPAATITALQSFPRPRRTTNPYLSQLMSSFPAAVIPLTFSWSWALRGAYDVFHVHWPELLIRDANRFRMVVRQVLFAVLLARIRLRRIAVVRTVHNAAPHEKGPRIESILLAALDRMTTMRVELNDAPRIQESERTRVILHGHYRDWYRSSSGRRGEPGQLLFFGLIRGYKRVPELLAAFAEVPDPSLRLHVVGRPADASLHAQLVLAGAGDPRVRCWLDHVDDDLLAAEIGSAELVILPYAEMYNSGAAILALSLDRPILVPQTPQNAALAVETGPGWVLMYDGDLTATKLVDGLAAADRAASVRGPRPRLSGRDWLHVGSAHLKVYREAMALARRRPPTVASATSRSA